MSWDVMIFAFESPPPPMDEWTDDFHPPSMGKATQIREQISHSLPQVDWSDPSWGHLAGGGYSIEFSLLKEDAIEGFMLHVRGGGNPLEAICKLCRENGWYALDCSTGDFIDLDAPSKKGWKGFQRYRDRVIGKLRKGSGKRGVEQ